MSFDEEMKKMSCEIKKEIQVEIDVNNRQIAVVTILSFVSVVILTGNAILSSHNIYTLCQSAMAGLFACSMTAINCFRCVRRANISFELLTSDLIQLLYLGIDEEGSGYLSDLKSGWINLELSQEQITTKELIFIIDHYWGRLIAWIRLPRFLTFTGIR